MILSMEGKALTKTYTSGRKQLAIFIHKSVHAGNQGDRKTNHQEGISW